MKLLLSTINCSYRHKSLALRWLYVAAPDSFSVSIKEFTLKDDINKMIDYYLLNDAQWIGFSVYIYNVKQIRTIVQQLKLLKPSLRIILGGPEVSYQFDEWFSFGVDAVVAGEGEQVLYEFLLNGSAAGVHTKDYKPLIGYAISDLTFLEKLKSPYFLELDQDNFNQQYFYFETSRGCPYRCSYCLSSNDQLVRRFSVDYIVKQLQQLKQFPVKQIKFLDRTFNLDDDLTIMVAKLIEELPFPVSAQMELVADIISPRLMDFLVHEAKVECYRFEIGVQSFNVATLQAVRRMQLPCLMDNIRSLIDAGYILHLDLIAGLPYEDLTSFGRGFDQLAGLKPAEIQVGILKLLKGTDLLAQSADYGLCYSLEAPYQVETTPWLSSDDLKVIQRVYHACEKFFNHGKLQHTMNYLWNRMNHSWFEVLAFIGLGLEQMVVPYQPYDLMHWLLQRAGDNELLRACLNEDYYYGSKMKLKRLFDLGMDVHGLALSHLRWLRYVTQMELYHYGFIYHGIEDGRLVEVLYCYGPKEVKRLVMDKGKELVVASHNRHKVQEFRAMLEPLGYRVYDLSQLKVDWVVEETGSTFQDNAYLKASEMAKLLNLPVLADDSGLEIAALDFAPGVQSARFMGVDTPYIQKNEWIVQRMKNESNRQARFVCVIAYVKPDGQGVLFEGVLDGTISDMPKGEYGFGYDPIFLIDDQQTLAEVPGAIKNQISHRALALRKFIEYFKEIDHVE
jgi:anaerobic magnesium-protoporphyrin IX monomethyl ester cyclase